MSRMHQVLAAADGSSSLRLVVVALAAFLLAAGLAVWWDLARRR